MSIIEDKVRKRLKKKEMTHREFTCLLNGVRFGKKDKPAILKIMKEKGIVTSISKRKIKFARLQW